MGSHPIDLVFVNGVAVSKASVRAALRQMIWNFPDASTLRTYDLDSTPLVAINGTNFLFDPLDFVTADDGVNCVLDLSARRFKKIILAVPGETIYRQQSVQAGSSATHYKIDTNLLVPLSATPILVIFVPDLNNLGGACDLKLDAQVAVSIKRWNNADPAADDLIAGVPYILSVTTTQATIYTSGSTA